MNQTLHFGFINGVVEKTFPCRCGETHRGDYAMEDWMHHNCFHNSVLVRVDGNQFLCPDCGKSFWAER